MKIHFNPIIDSTIAYFPRKYAEQGVMVYILALCLCSVLFIKAVMPAYLWAFGIFSVVLFFYGSYNVGQKWSRLRERAFVKNVFWYGFVIRAVYAIFIYWLNFELYGKHMEIASADAEFYQPVAWETAQLILTGRSNGTFMPATLSNMSVMGIWSYWTQMMHLNVTDIGYQFYLVLVYVFTGCMSDFILPLMLKALWGTLTCLLIYRIAQRHFGENVARMATIFCMLQWNMIWWCGSMMKETEMVFLGTWFVERMDRTLMGINVRPWFIVGSIVILMSLFTFRAALFMVAVAATGLALVVQRSKQLSMGKKILAGVLIVGALGLAVGDNIMNEVHETIERASSDHQQTNMEWRARREKGNEFAKYAGTTVFAPLIFTIPFPTMVYTFQEHEMQMQVSGGNFEKNVLSFFVIFAMFQLLLSGAWRQHVFPVAFLLGYLAALVLSEFAQSGRFHMPAMPFLMLFAAYGLTMVTSRKHKQWFTYALVVEVAFCVFWSWFKLKGRGMI